MPIEKFPECSFCFVWLIYTETTVFRVNLIMHYNRFDGVPLVLEVCIVIGTDFHRAVVATDPEENSS